MYVWLYKYIIGQLIFEDKNFEDFVDVNRTLKLTAPEILYPQK